VYLEFVDDELNPVAYNQRGSLIVTKLYGKGTPIIRYTGIEDHVTPIEKETNCGITTQMIGNIQGRKVDMIKLPSNRTITPLSITGIPAKVMEKYNSYKIKQFQIVQLDLHHIKVYIVIKENMRNVGISVEILFNDMKQLFKKILGPEIKVDIIETDEIQKDKRSDYVQVVISHVK
jgi:phenylacetate-coenzyme A ligase PaaK-like adenylate-forming protein